MTTRFRAIAVLFVMASLLSLVPCPLVTADETDENVPFPASIRVTDTVLNTVKPLIFGDNIEWTNSGMGLWLPGEKKFDESLVEPLRQAGITHLRLSWRDALGLLPVDRCRR